MNGIVRKIKILLDISCRKRTAIQLIDFGATGVIAGEGRLLGYLTLALEGRNRLGCLIYYRSGKPIYHCDSLVVRLCTHELVPICTSK